MSEASGDQALALALKALVDSARRAVDRVTPSLTTDPLLVGGAIRSIIRGEQPDALIAAFLTALSSRGPTAAELTAAVEAVRERMLRWDTVPFADRLLDTCGTGGDGAQSLNISTACAVLAAACGVPVAKHGNRSASGHSGSSEVLAELGVEPDLDPRLARQALEQLGITFLFAPRYHPALKAAAAARKLLPFRTLFNLVGPLANPLSPPYQMVGVSDAGEARLIAGSLVALGTQRFVVVTGRDEQTGAVLDEVTLAGPTRVIHFDRQGQGDAPPECREWEWMPEDFGLGRVDQRSLQVTGPVESASRIRAILAGGDDPAMEVLLANTAAALWTARAAADLPSGVEQASEAIRSGRALELLDRWSKLTRPAPTP